MARKRKKPTEEEQAEINTAVMATFMLNVVWRTASAQGVCPVCVVFDMAEMVQQALDDGHIDHGILEKIDDGDDVYYHPHSETLQ